ncbi:MAG: cadherin-like domain-containing protein [Lentisphaeria bacterium]|nr:cadherin-like domain-containing protein [Candidatus Neomarinimicrobiota bacterium]MCF7843125.1 cadherin-like domain-containing protein [Lentisphaeria bacterium]
MRRLSTILTLLGLSTASFTFAASDTTTVSITVLNNDVDWCNFQYPSAQSFESGSQFLVYAQAYEPGITDDTGQGSGITAEIGYSASDTDPSGTGWTWVTASYNQDDGNNDEYLIDFGAEVSAAGTYYVASRFSLDGTNFKYGGYSEGGGGFWDGETYTSVAYTVTVNTPPVLAEIADQVLTEDTPDTLTVNATDVDSDPVTFSISGGNAETVSASVRNDSIFFTPAADFNTGTPITFTVIASDGNGGSDTTTFDVTVLAVNDEPVIASLDDQEGEEGSLLEFVVSATDVDGDDLTWTAQNLPSGSNLSDNGDGTATFTWTPSYGQAGTYSDVTFIVDDGAGGQAMMRIRPPQTSQPVNRRR